jgi:NADH-quinone oxidoreductase subunit J
MEFLATHAAALLFYLFAAIAVGAAVLVVTVRNPMYCALALLTSFLSVAALFLLRGAELVAVVQIFVYGGGIMVLFLFVIMLVNLHRLQEVRVFAVGLPAAVVLGVLALALLGWALTRPFPEAQGLAAESFAQAPSAALGNSEAVAWILFRDYLLPFEIASLFLLVAMIGAVVLGRRE